MTFNWIVQYNDKTNQLQVEQDGKTNAYEDIRKKDLLSFSLVSTETGFAPVHIIFDGDGESLVWTRRVFQTVGGNKVTYHIVGKKGQFILAVDEQGSVIARHNFVNDGLFDEVING